MKAWQRQIREQIANREAGENLFGAWWDGIDRDISKARVKEISNSTAKQIILDYEWLGCMPAIVWHSYGIFFNGCLAGVVVYGVEYAENLGVWSRYGYDGKIINLARGACTHWAHPHSASRLIRRSMTMLPAKYEVVTATVDRAAGEIGTIYQACGFHYVGAMRENPPTAKPVSWRNSWMVGKKLIGSRTMRRIVGSTKIEDILKIYPNAITVPQHSKERYFAFRGSHQRQKQHYRAIQHLIRPYPKRAVEVSGETRAETISEGVGRFHDTAPILLNGEVKGSKQMSEERSYTVVTRHTVEYTYTVDASSKRKAMRVVLANEVEGYLTNEGYKKVVSVEEDRPFTFSPAREAGT